MALSEKQIEKLLRGVFDGDISLFDLPNDVFEYTFKELRKSVETGFGGTINNFAKDTIKHNKLLEYIKNIFNFSGAKTFNEVKDLSLVIFNEDGTKRSFKEFKEYALSINEQYNVNYLRTEQDTAFAMAQEGEKWLNIENESDLFPMLKYETAGDERVREEHRDWDQLMFPVGHEFWNTRMPPNGYNCYDKETNVYTDQGWKLFSELDKTEKVLTLNPDTKDLEWQKPINYINYHYAGKMINIEANNMSICVTPDHNMLIRKSWDKKMKRESLRLIKANKIASEDQIYRASEWKGESLKNIKIGNKIIDIDTYVKFMAWYLADGSVTKRKDNVYQIKISQNPGILYDKLKEDIKNLPVNIYYGKDYIGFNDAEIGNYLATFGKCNEKYIPYNIKRLSKDKLRAFLDIYVITDGYSQNQHTLPVNHYYTSSKKMADDLSELIIKVNKACSITLLSQKGKETTFKNGTYKSNYDVYEIRELNTTYFNLSKKRNISTIDYNDKVYCAEVPKYNTLLVSKKGKIYWSGNCRCTVTQHTEGSVSDLKGVPKNSSDMFSVNPGKVNYIFNPDEHPYFKVEKIFRKDLDNNFGFKMP